MPLPADETSLFIDEDGTRIPLDPDECEKVRQILRLRLIEGGLAAANAADPLISTGKAAQIIGMSRRTVVRYLDAGEIPYERYGDGHRRIRLSEVMRFKEQADIRHQALSDFRRDSYLGGLDDLDMIEEYLSQFKDEDEA